MVAAMLSVKVISEYHGSSLIDYLAHAFGVSKKKAKLAVDERRVFVNRRRIWMAKYKLSAGDLVEFQEGDQIASVKELSIIWESAALLVVNKPSGVLSEGAGSVEELLRKQRKDSALRLVHRLDKDTTGCLMVARSDESFEDMKGQFEHHRVKKIYRALVSGIVERDKFVISTPIDGKSAKSDFRVLARSPQATELEISIETGRMHQIRKHILSAGHQVIGDKKYGDSKRLNTTQRGIARQMLHAHKISFLDPTSEKRIEVEAPFPKDFISARRSVGLGSP